MKRFPLLFSMCLLLLLSGGCGAQKTVSRDVFAMDTYMHLSCSGRGAEDALEACQAEIFRLEALFSATLAGSDVSRINHAAGKAVTVDPDTAALLLRAKALSRLTDGAFALTIRPLVEAWGFSSDAPHVPDAAVIDALLPLPDETAVDVAGTAVQADAGTGIDLGGIAKGFCSERLCGLLRARGVKSALLTLGGNVEAVGGRPDGTPWRVGVRDPEDADAIVGVVEITDKAVVTSGGYQRYFEEDGQRFHHILDPQTGRPADSGLLSVTVIADSGTDADALSTAFYVLGMEASMAILRELTESSICYDVIFIISDGTIYCTENSAFTPDAGKVCRIISK